MIMSKSNHKVLNFSILVILFYTLWGFLFTKTTFANSLFEYLFFVGAFCLFALCLFLYKCRKINEFGLAWTPYLLITIIGYFLSGNLEYSIYWCICLFLLIISASMSVYDSIPYRFLFISGGIAISGQLIQLFIPAVYNSTVLPLFINRDQIAYWGTSYGIAGFTYQLDSTAIILVIAEAVALYTYMNDTIKNKRRYKYFYTALFVCGIFLAGKRMLFLIAIIVPSLIFLLTEKTDNKKIRRVLIGVVIGCSLIGVFINNIQYFSGNRYFLRFATTILNIQNNIDISTGRGALYQMAIDAFKSHPLFGIGVGNYISYTGSQTAVHNTYLQVLCEQGIIGFIFFIIPLIITLSATIRALKQVKDVRYKAGLNVSLFLQMVYMLNGLTENVNVNLFGFMTYFIGISIFVSTKRDAVSF